MAPTKIPRYLVALVALGQSAAGLSATPADIPPMPLEAKTVIDAIGTAAQEKDHRAVLRYVSECFPWEGGITRIFEDLGEDDFMFLSPLVESIRIGCNPVPVRGIVSRVDCGVEGDRSPHSRFELTSDGWRLVHMFLID